MPKLLFFLLLTAGFSAIGSAQTSADSALIRSIYDEALARGEAYENLRQLTKGIGHRLSGSESASRAMEWGPTLVYGSVPVTEWTLPDMCR